jgi:hypothetical protein
MLPVYFPEAASYLCCKGWANYHTKPVIATGQKQGKSKKAKGKRKEKRARQKRKRQR